MNGNSNERRSNFRIIAGGKRNQGGNHDGLNILVDKATKKWFCDLPSPAIPSQSPSNKFIGMSLRVITFRFTDKESLSPLIWSFGIQPQNLTEQLLEKYICTWSLDVQLHLWVSLGTRSTYFSCSNDFSRQGSTEERSSANTQKQPGVGQRARKFKNRQNYCIEKRNPRVSPRSR